MDEYKKKMQISQILDRLTGMNEKEMDKEIREINVDAIVRSIGVVILKYSLEEKEMTAFESGKNTNLMELMDSTQTKYKLAESEERQKAIIVDFIEKARKLNLLKE